MPFTGARRRELRRLARRGLAHPDPQLRRPAVAWARRRRVSALAVGLEALGVAALAAGAFYGSAVLVALVRQYTCNDGLNQLFSWFHPR
ncbi:hypothetical protein ACPPVO_19930 [Dactylosporangium sp. McL0621]|uniref:hypothetical protein n=1 Tax=Dactylosporangium sp. McL0621 TaxID=3415678 RepID=UPI003CFB3638